MKNCFRFFELVIGKRVDWFGKTVIVSAASWITTLMVFLPLILIPILNYETLMSFIKG